MTPMQARHVKMTGGDGLLYKQSCLASLKDDEHMMS